MVALYLCISVFNVFFTDTVKIKEKKRKKSKQNTKKEEEEEEEEISEKIQYDDEILAFDNKIMFSDMNLSRPLLKVKVSVSYTNACIFTNFL